MKLPPQAASINRPDARVSVPLNLATGVGPAANGQCTYQVPTPGLESYRWPARTELMTFDECNSKPKRYQFVPSSGIPGTSSPFAKWSCCA